MEAEAERSHKRKSPYSSRQMPPARRNLSPYDASPSSSQAGQPRTRQDYNQKTKDQLFEAETFPARDGFNSQQQPGCPYGDEPPSYCLHAYDAPSSSRPRSSQMPTRLNVYQQPSYSCSSPETIASNTRFPFDQSSFKNTDFRPLILPQIAFGEGEPFLRGYSSEMDRYGISCDQFLRVVDVINVARTPNPEVKLFQMGAGIAGWFVPGVASIGLLAGQAGVGVATAFGHASIVSEALSKANMELFSPNGLKICIITTEDLNTELGISSYGIRDMPYNTSPVDRLSTYGPRIAFVNEILPDRSDMERQDPLAKAGRALNKRANKRKAQDAQERLDKGEKKDKGKRRLFKSYDDIEWLVVKLAPPLNNAAFLVFLATLRSSFAYALPSEVNLRRRDDSKNVTQLQIIPDVDFNFNVMATLATAPYQGADIGEILVAASQIKTGDFESHYKAYYDLATRVHDQAKAIDCKKHPVSARNAIMSLWKQQADAFDKPGRRPTVILGTGYDGSMEDLYHTMGEALLQRGMNAIVYEGPGQPTVRRYQDLGFIPEWERAVTPIVDYALSRDDVDGSKLALMGFSFGGVLAPRAAAFEHRLAAVIALDGVFDFGQAMFKQFGPEITELFKAGKKKEIDEAVALAQNNASMPSTLRWGIDQGEWSFKTHSAYTLLEKSQGSTLKGIVDKIKAPVFVGDGQNDMFFPGQAKELTKQLGSRATYQLFETASGAGLHCQVGGYVLMNQVSLDWLEDVFANQTRHN
ncbi:hydrolase or acyltransferase (alpha beta hydrolase superfamily) [Fusarium tjaetaba]|uniref:Hydrolase or acyltransferase (Alpha beta hydrolase superfamily) n=1 Tax=Fusarium tjaetaba TaxID=1567544 RepID=A0A8H5RXH9_9HYPO|nr:hydrolase or acyltransferase (alpha beta hydrolase superfamily) [Fusarium tjaetaba]KAF5640904.1 hydrolase or acyltransferase (alpha beta hydrolase superfamily) [Fusarium tjaetaba]